MNLSFFKSKPKYIKQLEKDLNILRNQIDEKEIQAELNLLEKSYSNSSFDGGTTVVGEQYDKAKLQKLMMSETWFSIAVRTIALSIGSLPIKIEKRFHVREEITHPNGKKESVLREVWVEASGEPEQKIFNDPNELNTAIEFWMLIVLDLLATGEAFVFVEKDESLLNANPAEDRLRESLSRARKSSIKNLWRLNSAQIQPILSEDESKILDGYQLLSELGEVRFTTQEIIHIKLPNPCDPLSGYPPILSVLKELLLDRFSKEHMMRFYKQGARLGGVISTKKKLTKEQIVRLEKTFTATMTGKRNHHKTLIMPEGMEYKIVEQNPGETSLIEFLKANKEPILAAYNVPPIKVGLLDGATFANAMVQNETYYTDTVKPNARFIEQAINKSDIVLTQESGLRMVFDFGDIKILQEDDNEKALRAKAMLEAGLSINEVRERIWKEKPADGGDIIPALVAAKPVNSLSLLSSKPNDQKVDTLNTQNDTDTLGGTIDTSLSLDERIMELVGQAMARGIALHLALPKAIEQARLEGFAAPGEEKKTQEDKTLSCGLSQSQAVEHLKVLTGEGVQGLIENRQKQVLGFFNRLGVEISKRSKSLKIKALVPTLDDLKLFIEQEVEFQIVASKDAVKHGYDNSTIAADLSFPESSANQLLKQTVGRNVKSVTDTSLKKLKRVVADGFEEQASVTEISSRLQDEIKKMSSGKANTIARTETLSAVSLGQEVKRREFKEKFPEQGKKLRKMWLTAEDDKVRKTHIVNNEVVIGIDEKFANGLLYPRDPEGSASEVINCRCSLVDFMPDDENIVNDIVGDNSPLAAPVAAAEKRLRMAITKKRLNVK